MNPALPTPGAFGAPPDDAGLPDWLTGADLEPAGGSDLLLARALQLPDLPPELLGAPDLAKLPAPAPAGDAFADPADGWSVTHQAVPRDPAEAPGALGFRFNVKNHSATSYYECRCTFALPRGLKNVRASGTPRRTSTALEWRLGDLAPGATVGVLVKLPLTPQTERFLREPAAVRIATRPAAAPPPAVAVADLTVACDHEPLVLASAPVLVRVAVSNRGAAASRRLRIEVFAPTQPVPVARTEADPVPANAATAFDLLVPPAAPGETSRRVVVTAPGLPPVHTTLTYRTAAHELALDLVAPATLDVDDEATCRLSVVNRGALPVAGVCAALGLPEELVFRGADAGGTLSFDGTGVEWPALALAPGARWEATFRVAGFAPGRTRLRATVCAPGGPDVSADAPLVCAVRKGAGASLASLLTGLAERAPDDEERTTKAAAVGERHLLFRVAGGRFAAPLRDVREVLRPLPVTPLPGAAPWLAGVANVRGDIVSVVDLATFLELDGPAPRRGLVILGPAGDDRLGLLVDDVLGIRPLAPGSGDAPGDAVGRFLAGLTLDADGVVHRLDSDKLLAATDTGSGAAV